MAQDSYDFFKHRSLDLELGGQGTHADLTYPLTTGGSYYRDYTVNQELVKGLLTGSNFQNLDGSQAISIRATLRAKPYKNWQIWLLAKAGATNPFPKENPVIWEPGYKVGIRAPGTNQVNNIYFHAYNGTNYYDGLDSGRDSNTGHTPDQTQTNTADKWVYLRMDVCPIVQTSDNSITGDKILMYRSFDDGATWTIIDTHIMNTTDSGFIPWSDANYNRYGFMTLNGLIDNFEVYLSTGYV